MSDHIGEPNAMICPHCGLPADRNQNGIQGYRCGSSYCETFKPQWARSMTCLEMEIRHLNEDIGNMNMQLVEQEDYIKRLEEAGDQLFELCDATEHQFHLADEIPQRLEAWTTAKEAKP
jgi:hypothetical protein